MSDNEEKMTIEEHKIMRRREAQKRYYQRNKEQKIKYQMDRYVPKTKTVIEYQLPIITENTVYNLNEVLGLILKTNDYESVETQKTHSYNIKRLFVLTGMDNFKEMNERYKEIADLFKNPANGKSYSINSLRATISTLLATISKFKIDLFSKKAMESFNDIYSTWLMQSIEQNEERVEKITVPTFTTYLRKIKSKFGEGSKQYLVAMLYSVFTIRDNYAGMIFTSETRLDDLNNYMVMMDNDDLVIYLHNFKTDKKYDRIIFKLPVGVKKLVLNWVYNNDIRFGQKLFKESSLSPFVSEMHKSINYDGQGSINLFRHMRVAELSGATYEEKIETAKQMQHGIVTQKKYHRNLEVEEF